MSKNRIYDLARQLNVPSRELIDFLKVRGIEVKSHMSTVDEGTADLILKSLGKKDTAEPIKKDENFAKEKKINARTYIPPRRRKKKRYEPVKPPVRQEVLAKPSQQPQGPGSERKHEAKTTPPRFEKQQEHVIVPEPETLTISKPKSPSVEEKAVVSTPKAFHGEKKKAASGFRRPPVKRQKADAESPPPRSRKTAEGSNRQKRDNSFSIHPETVPSIRQAIS